MSYLAIIIGFGYRGDGTDGLAFTTLDIENMRKMVEDGGGISVVLTDIVKETVDPRWMIVKDRNGLEGMISKLEINYEPRLLIYYTGHGDVDSKMRLPDGSPYLLADFRDFIVKKTNESSEIVFILDCCYSGGLMLPYQLSLDSCGFRIATLERPAIPMILCLSSSLDNQKSAAVETHGSIFTRHLSSAISSGYNNLITISKVMRSRIMAEGIDNEQTMSIHSSYPIPPVLWTWVTNPKINIYVNDPTSTLIIEHLSDEAEPQLEQQ